jgi:hypothetical protein
MKSALAALPAMQASTLSTRRVVLTVQVELTRPEPLLDRVYFAALVHIPVNEKQQLLAHLAMLGHFQALSQ